MTVAAPYRPPVVDDALFEALVPLGSYRYEVGVPLERVYENLMDWEHLPHIHASTFASVELLHLGRWFWHARVGMHPIGSGRTNEVVLVIDPDARHWAVHLIAGPRQDHWIRSRAVGDDPDATVTEVTFYAPTAPRNEAARAAMGHYFREQYHRLYQEDSATMVARQEALERRRTRVTDVDVEAGLGPVDEVVARAPFRVTLRGSRYWVSLHRGELVTYGADCPHQLGPVDCRPDAEGTVGCPWHGYRFHVADGRSADEHGLRLRRPPRLEVRDGRVFLVAGTDTTTRGGAPCEPVARS